jgi:hypothetical protein
VKVEWYLINQARRREGAWRSEVVKCWYCGSGEWPASRAGRFTPEGLAPLPSAGSLVEPRSQSGPW